MTEYELELSDAYEQLSADADALAERLLELENAARAYRSILYGAEMRNSLDEPGLAELNTIDDQYSHLIDDDDEEAV